MIHYQCGVLQIGMNYILFNGIIAIAEKNEFGGGRSLDMANDINADSYRKILNVVEGIKRDKENWKNFFIYLKNRDISGNRRIIGDTCLCMLKIIPEVFSDATYLGCTMYFYHNVPYYTI